MTTENPTKPNGDPNTRQKHPKQELNQKKKQQKLRNSHENHPKLTWSSPKPLTLHQDFFDVLVRAIDTYSVEIAIGLV